VRELARALPKGDVIIADPPYNETALEWDRWPKGWPLVAHRLLKASGSMWCFGSMRMFFKYLKQFEGWSHAQEIVWEKHNGSNSAAPERIRKVHELALHFFRGEWEGIYKAAVYSQDAKRRRVHRQKKPAHWNGIGASTYESEAGGKRLLRSVIYARSMHGRALNPTQKPLEIICPMIEYSCPPGGLVIDAFMGSGSVLVAARRLGRRAIGIDTRLSQCKIAVSRLRTEA
jgi:site-specific DNA-methyltransferase (adenine-specific)